MPTRGSAADGEGPPRTGDALAEYHRKRSADRTPEPAGAVSRDEGRRFVVQKHHATRMHYDLRLEHGGVLLSWAVPKGPSYDMAEKRLAVMTEDHPVEYANFEGVIPEGNYGAGAVIVWDTGTYVAVEDIGAGLEKGKLLFELRGHKLRGRWTLVKIRKDDSPRDWLLIKERDGNERPGPDGFQEDSVFSGMTLEDLEQDLDADAQLLERVDALDAPSRKLSVDEIDVMLATSRENAFTREGWLFELKYDGYRLLAGKDGDRVGLRTRSGRDVTGSFPDIARALRRLPFERFVLDGEVVVHDEAGIPNFQRLQRRAQLRRPPDIRRAAAELPATFYAFDLPAFGHRDLRRLVLTDRKAVLRSLLPSAGVIRFSDHVPERGEELFESVARMGLEGVVAKKADSPYRSGRSRDWYKIRADRVDDFAVVGYTAPKGSRTGFGALHLAGVARAGAEVGMAYVGSVGGGFTGKQLDEIAARLEGAVRETAPCEGAPDGGGDTWVEPELVVEVRYREITDDGLLRHPVFLRLRDDKRPDECELPARASGEEREARSDLLGGGAESSLEAAASGPAIHDAATGAGAPVVHFTNLDKTFWPEEGYTKGDLIDYYRRAADWMLPYLRDRPVVLTRYPDGVEGKSFFQKDAPGFAPDWIRRLSVWSDDSQRELSYFVLDDVASLLYVANSASIPLHVWASREPSLERPDWCILDLDPKDAPFDDVVEVALALKALTDDIGLPAFVKTTGSTGLHVLVPVARQLTHDQSKQLAELLARVVVRDLPEIATVERSVRAREGRVYVDYLQNGHGKLLVAPFSVRPVPGAMVSAPLRWREVKKGLDISRFTIRSLPRRMSQMKEDPMAGVLEAKPNLTSALGKLARRMGADA